MSSSLAKQTVTNKRAAKITSQQWEFIKAMQSDPAMSPSRAAKKAGYASPYKSGNALMKKPHIQAEIGKELKKRLDRLELSGDRLLEELAYMALRDPIDLCDEETGEIIIDDLRKIPERMRRCIEGIETVDTYDSEGNMTRKTKIRLCSKTASVEMAMKHFGMFEKDNSQQSGNVVIVNWDTLTEPVQEQKPGNVIEVE